MTNTKQYYVTGKMEVAISLLRRGFLVVDTRLDNQNNRFVVFVFELTDELKKAVKEIKLHKQK